MGVKQFIKENAIGLVTLIIVIMGWIYDRGGFDTTSRAMAANLSQRMDTIEKRQDAADRRDEEMLKAFNEHLRVSEGLIARYNVLHEENMHRLTSIEKKLDALYVK